MYIVVDFVDIVENFLIQKLFVTGLHENCQRMGNFFKGRVIFM